MTDPSHDPTTAINIESEEARLRAEVKRLEKMLATAGQLSEARNQAYEEHIAEENKFIAAVSLCEGCQEKRESRRIIASPRIQVEEELDRARVRIAALESSLRDLVDRMRRYEMDVDECPPNDHRLAMERAEALLKTKEG